jgi:hypothetical protein
VPQAAIATQIHQPFDIHSDFAPQIAFHAIFAVDQFTDAKNLVVRKLIDPAVVRDAKLLADRRRLGWADSINVAKPDGHSLVGRDIHAGNTRHARLSCRPVSDPDLLLPRKAEIRARGAKPIWGCAEARDYSFRRAGVNEDLSILREDCKIPLKPLGARHRSVWRLRQFRPSHLQFSEFQRLRSGE